MLGLVLTAGCGSGLGDTASPAGGTLSGPGPAPAGSVGAGCAGVPAQGLCEGSRLLRCADDEVVATDCATNDASCGWVDESTGMGCRPPPNGHTHVTGRLEYLERPVGPEGLGEPILQPVRGATVQLRRQSDDEVLAWGVTDREGRYRLTHAAEEAVYVLGLTVAGMEGYPLAVRDCPLADCGRGNLYAIASAPFEPSGDQDLGTLEARQEAVAGAFHVFDRLLDGMDLAWAGFTAPPTRLTAQWRLGSGTVCGTSCYRPDTGTLYVLGSPEDEDQWDDGVLGHELGHYLEHGWSRSDNPGGAHDGSPADPRLAWSEGLGTFVGTLLGSAPVYVDTFAAGRLVIDLSDTGYRADPQAPLTQALSEFVVGEALWGLAATASSDPATDPRPVFDVLESWLSSPSLVDRGHPGVDLVDFLDGWLCRGHAHREQLDALVLDRAGFPYDYAGPPSCL